MKKRIQKESRENKMSMSDNARKVWITFLYLFGAMVVISFIVALSGLKMLSDNPAVFIVRMEMDNNTLKATEYAQQKVCQPVQCNCGENDHWYDDIYARGVLMPLNAQTTNSVFTPKKTYTTLTDKNLVTNQVTTYRFSQGNYDELNWAQKFLLNTHIVPMSWVLE